MNLVYIERDENLNIVGVYANPQYNNDGSLRTSILPIPDTDREVEAFLLRSSAILSAWQDAYRLDNVGGSPADCVIDAADSDS